MALFAFYVIIFGESGWHVVLVVAAALVAVFPF